MLTILKHNQEIHCTLKLEDGDTLYPKYILETNCRGWKNKYRISTKVCGLNECSERSLYFGVSSAECLNLDNTNEETLVEEAIRDIFEELTQENY
jgi:hypothetical protein